MKIEDYGLIGDLHTAALVGNNGSVDWLCLPRFDSGACFAALLGEPRHGRWQLAPADGTHAVRRRYRPDTLVLETEFEDGAGGCVRLVDCMPPRRGGYPEVVRLVEGVAGRVAMRMELVVRFDYGRIRPWVKVGRPPGELRALAGPDALVLRTPVPLRPGDAATVAEFTVGPGERVPFVLSWHPSHEPTPAARNAEHTIADTAQWWRAWTGRATCGTGEWAEPIKRSLITLKALIYQPSGGIVAAPTTSLPERIGGARNWDYRFCWLRDAAFTLDALLGAGYTAEAGAWRDWLLRAVAGDPADVQILYGPQGERRLPEFELPELPGYEGSRPVRVGNAASGQFQLDVYGEVIYALHRAHRAGLAEDPEGIDRSLPAKLLAFLESHWFQPDEGIWEVRGPRRHFTYSKVMAWVAVDRLLADAARYGLTAELDRWQALRASIHRAVCAQGYGAGPRAFTQFYGSGNLDASILLMPLVGFLPATDPRVRATVEAVERELLVDGFVRRCRTDADGASDGLPGEEGAFLPCTFWLADNYHLLGRPQEARAVFERLLALRNDLGLLSEEYDPRARRLVGNFPQAFSHVALVNTAFRLQQR